MVRRKAIQPPKKEKVPKVKHYCGECALGTFYYTHNNIDLNGKPICLKCPHSDTSRIRSELACRYFKEKEDGKE